MKLNLKPKTVQLTREQHAKLEQRSKQLGIGVGGVVRIAVDRYLNADDADAEEL